MKVALLLGFTLACGNLTAQTQDATQGEKEREAMNPTEAESAPVIAVGIEKSRGMFGRESIYMVREGESIFFETYGVGQRAEIGVWRHAIPSSMFEDLVGHLEGSNYMSIPQQRVLMPGQGVMVVEVTRGGGAEPYRDSFLPQQPELALMMDRVSKIRAELRKHPSQVLRGEARWRSESVTKSNIAMFDVTLSNPGSQRIEIENPVWERAEGLSGLRIWLQASPIEAGKTVDVLAKDVQAIDAASASPVLALAPGQQVGFVGRTSLATIAPGRCKAALDIRSNLTRAASQDFVDGRLSIDMGTVTIVQ